MLSRFFQIFAIVLIGTAQATAATLYVNEGMASVSRGDGYLPASNGMELAVGDRVIVSQASSITIVYSPGCQLPVGAGQVVTIPAEAPCLAPQPTATTGAAPIGAPMSTYVIGGVIVAGAVGAAIGLSGGGGHSP